MKALNYFGLDVVKDAPGIPVPMVERAVRQAAIEFCEYTKTWRATLDLIDVVDGTRNYTLTPPDDSRVVTVVYASHDDIRIVPTTQLMMDTDEDSYSWRLSTTKAANAAWYYLPDRTTIRLSLTPDADLVEGLLVEVALKPTQSARQLPDILWDDNLEAIRNGALARLMLVPGAHQDQKLATYYRGLFDVAMGVEKAERMNDYTRESSLQFGLPYGRRCNS